MAGNKPRGASSRTVLFVMAMKSCDTAESHGTLSDLWKIFIGLQADRHTKPHLGVQTLGSACNAQNPSAAAYVHALAQCDLRRHSQRQLDFRAFGYRQI